MPDACELAGKTFQQPIARPLHLWVRRGCDGTLDDLDFDAHFGICVCGDDGIPAGRMDAQTGYACRRSRRDLLAHLLDRAKQILPRGGDFCVRIHVASVRVRDIRAVDEFKKLAAGGNAPGLFPIPLECADDIRGVNGVRRCGLHDLGQGPLGRNCGCGLVRPAGGDGVLQPEKRAIKPTRGLAEPSMSKQPSHGATPVGKER